MAEINLGGGMGLPGQVCAPFSKAYFVAPIPQTLLPSRSLCRKKPAPAAVFAPSAIVREVLMMRANK